LIHHLYGLLVKKTGVITRAKSGSALSRVGARKGIRPMAINSTANANEIWEPFNIASVRHKA